MPTADAPLIVTGAPAWRARIADTLRDAGLPTPDTPTPTAALSRPGVLITDPGTLARLTPNAGRATLALVRLERDLARALDLGADDAELESASPAALRARVHAACALAAARAHRPTPLHDEPTGAYRADVFDLALARDLATAERLGLPLSLVCVAPRDHAPDAAAVTALKRVVRRRTDLIGASDTHLSVLLPHTPHADALRLARDMREALRALPATRGRRVTYGIGVATTVEDDAARLTERALAGCRASQGARGHVNGDKPR
ncbi:diguanylate cyclase [Deinococcus maricopensis]|uniref:GGDEF domain containing protein n=1 Tax=Deinococcus maricopensis (strain DSM 21211 / LMG 22137 / NRRL B-23946 / LB-34) TaxID=709986 RepID=E8U743_DEIML|nr:diguanylate cyclase [Deinococcus maricopensis]ADV66882.1 GGDEF domain containing protein [Deinococcus maricopensis DSM 21211]